MIRRAKTHTATQLQKSRVFTYSLFIETRVGVDTKEGGRSDSDQS